tara:strand:+ start:4575 stop:6200 length:1626 start_codon:yes stop_codon:yes gene_type:complete
MSNKKTFYLIIFISLLFGFTLIVRNDKIKLKDIKSALKVSGVIFKDEQINTMTNYIERNKSGYIEMRGYQLDNDVTPALKYSIPNNLNNNFSYDISSDSLGLPKNKREIAHLQISELAYLIKNKKISSLELTEIYLNRIKKLDKKINAFVTITETLAIEQAKKADKEIKDGNYKGLLHGIPYGIKDLASYPKFPTTWGAMPLKNQVINKKAEVIEKLEKAGAVMLGKLSTGSLARGDVWFKGKTKNPWNLSQGSSGSSAGSASATAAGLVAFSIGTETLGSIVSPATRCGVTGLRPTFGSVSTDGFMTLSWSMDKVGPITRTAKGSAIVFNTIRNTGEKKEKKEIIFDKKLKKIRIGFLEELFLNDTSRYSENNNITLSLLKEDYTLEKVSLPIDYPYSVFDIILRSEAGAFFDEFLLNNLDSNMVQQGERSRANSLRQSRLIPAVEYIQANRHRSNLISEFNSIINDYDVIISPTFGKNQMLITNLTGHPVISVPNGFDKKGNPTSISFIGNYHNEDKILYLASLYQTKTNFHRNAPSGF